MDPDTTLDDRAYVTDDGTQTGREPEGEPAEAHDARGADAEARGGDADTRPLEERLRRLNWPQPPEGLRERTLEELQRKLGEAMDGSSNGGHPQDGAPAGDAAAAADRRDPGEPRE